MNRPKCTYEGCANLAAKWTKSNGTTGFRKVCWTHMRKQYQINNTRRPRWKKELKKDYCELCGWNIGSCDTHRIVLGKDGGDYIQGNVLTLCPNCHRLVHQGLLQVK